MEAVEVEAIAGGVGREDVRGWVIGEIITEGFNAARDMFKNPTNAADCEKMDSYIGKNVCEAHFETKAAAEDNAKVIWMQGEHDLSYDTTRLRP